MEGHFLRLFNPICVLHEGEIDRPVDDESEVLISMDHIAIIRRHPSKRTFVFYVHHEKFNCFVSNPDQYEELSADF